MSNAVALAIVSSLVVGGCGSPGAPPAARSAPLKIAAYYWPGTYWVDIANQRGWFAEAGLDVTVVDTNADYLGSIKDLVAGRLDSVGLTLFDLVRLNTGGDDLVGVAVTDQSSGADGIAVRPGIMSIADLKGRRIGAGTGTYVEYILSVVLGLEGLSLTDVRIVDMPGEQSPKALAGGTVDAVVTWEPILAEAARAVNGQILWNSTRVQGISPALLALRGSVIRDRPADVAALLRVWHRATTFILADPAAAYAIVARVNRKTPAEVEALAGLDRILDWSENRRAFSMSGGFESLHGGAKVISEFLIEKRLTTTRPASNTFLDDRFLRDLAVSP